jgi:hypothetical protein
MGEQPSNLVNRSGPATVIRRPLIDVKTAMAILDCNEDHVLKRIEDGAIPWVWDIRRNCSVRSCLRLLTRSVVEAQEPQSPGVPVASDEQELASMVDSLLPRTRPTLRGTEVARLFNCSSSHITGLIKDGLLHVSPRETTSFGTDSSPWIARVSLSAFLQKRRFV